MLLLAEPRRLRGSACNPIADLSEKFLLAGGRAHAKHMYGPARNIAELVRCIGGDVHCGTVWNVHRVAAECELHFAFKQREHVLEIVAVGRRAASVRHQHVNQTIAPFRLFAGDQNGIEVFELVAALHGFKEAARALGLPKSNVSRSVARLGGALGARLFHRSTRDVTLTSAGIALRDRARDIIERAGEAFNYVGSLSRGPRAPIKINSGIGFGLNFLGPELPSLLQRYSDVDITLDLESRSADLVGEAIDVAVRVGPLHDSSHIAVRLGAMRRYLCASRSYVERRGAPTSIDALKDHAIIEMPGSDGRPRPWVFTQDGEESRVALRPRVTVNEALTVHRLVLSGAGLGIVSGYLCAPGLADGNLVHLLPDWSLPSVEVSLVSPSRRELSPAVRALADFMKEISRPGELWQNDPLAEHA